ncbi:hypothetical protein [uncultured Oscillibacter sp.]|uniref:hypothetical protein n=1 Tax=uncultured Oscillibacter sp. TaxID=876091 RepID=UPI0025DAACE0|nr:hypothetical protein [uncultured Oscillibacter sp.]
MGGSGTMEQAGRARVWRIWVDAERKIVSFHEMKGARLLEFRNWEMFISAVDDYAKRQFRYQ